MAGIREVRYSGKQTIESLPLGTVFKYKDRWYIRSDIYFHDDMELTLRQLGVCDDCIAHSYYCLGVDLVTGYPELAEHQYSWCRPEAISSEIDIKMRI